MTSVRDRTIEWARSAGLLAASLGVVACQSSSSGGAAPSISAAIGPEGGSLVASDGTRVDVPAGALPATATLTLRAASGVAAPAGGAFASTPWTLEPDWLQFAEPITVTFPIEPGRLDGGAIVASTAQGVSGYLAFAATRVDGSHVAARTTHFATGGPVEATCPAICTGSVTGGETSLRCATTCLGHAYLLSCAGPPESTPCTCSVDGVVTGAARLDTRDGGAAPIYLSFCELPASSLMTTVSTAGDAGAD